MKKLFLLCATVFVIMRSAAQQNNIPVMDTLRYFTYKQLYKLPPTTSITTHPYFKSVAPVSGAGSITHVGSVFKNRDASLRVYGLEAQVLIPAGVVSSPATGGVPFRLYLCNVVNGLPVFPPLDSISVKASSVQPIQYGAAVGGSFTNSPVNVSGDFAVLARCISSLSGDTVNILRTAGHTGTSTSAPGPAHRFGEGMGVIRNAGIFYKTANYNNPAFGFGTDYEFCVSPMVSFSLQVSQIESPTQQGACEWEVFTNTNTSSPELTNRQFNFNEFYRRLKPFNPLSAISTGFSPDSILAWDMGDGMQPFYLKADEDTIHLAYASGNFNQFFYGAVIGKYKRSVYNVNAQSVITTLTFSGSCVWCNDSTLCVGINRAEGIAELNIYPNPTADKIIIAGLKGNNTISVFNMAGQLVLGIGTSEKRVMIDLAKQPQGCYVIRISDAKNNWHLKKIIRE